MREELSIPLFAFAKRWLKQPVQVGAIAPSSQRLARAMAQALPDTEGVVIELGPGTGAITRGLLSAKTNRHDLLLIEKDEFFAEHLQRYFPGLKVVCSEAENSSENIAHHIQGRPVRAIVSSLPLRNMRADRQVSALDNIIKLAGNAPLIQYTYGIANPLQPEAQQRLRLLDRRLGMVWANLPPASIWRYERAASI